ncbi:MgtC/SapB transporter [Nostoc sp. NIES-3756]|uniref:MgtC/SapB family protein n=1 Tax=Nostoc sp. NIES-3756 TaxID=1751286 RepID=UPI000722702B|nr:MgtC/SapB family protein [Nostoc sp. NIES-3756]BAT55633.1 MgtC/SapB transporter [Nostoc sp. NIES-3756]BAY36604.1 MgtC/SapB transporter [Nostoc sp. NIES-2111]
MLDNRYLAHNDFLQLIFRLFLALLIGAIIGLERQLRHKPAGLRTHMLVSFGSAVFVLIPLQLTTIQSHPEMISRVIQGIASGVGFLGAGEIVRESSQESQRLEIHGLTSAAAIWVSASLGIAAGCGLWQMGLVGAIITFAILNLFKKLERH